MSSVTVVDQQRSRPQRRRPAGDRRGRGRRPAAAVLVAAAAVLAGAAAPAWAGVSLTVAPDPPSAVVVGQTGDPSTLTVANASSGVQAGTSLTVDEITLVPGCERLAAGGADCSAAAAAPGVLRPSATGFGLAGTACAGTSFTIDRRTAVPGEYRLTPSAPVVLGPAGSPTAACIVGFTFAVARGPAADADPAVAGTQVAQVAYAHGVDAAGGGLGAAASGSNELTVSRADEAPSAAYVPSTGRPRVGQAVSFDAAASSDPDGSIAAYRWVWGDGTPDGSGPSATHVFGAVGLFSVGLYVTDSDGQTAAAGRGISVHPAGRASSGLPGLLRPPGAAGG
jgi:hypothetical protein